MAWDETTRDLLERSRLVFMPLINPAGMYLKRRSNPNGVDLMRNAPIEGEEIPSLLFLQRPADFPALALVPRC